MGPTAPIQPHAASYTPGVRLLLLLVLVGLLLAWPLVRLSGPGRAWPIRQALLDVVVLLCLVQVVVWPLRLLTSWPPLRSAAIDLTIGGWALAASAIVAMGTVPGARRLPLYRSLAMAGALILVCGMPLALLILSRPLPFVSDGALAAADAEWWRTVAFSPLSALYALASGSPTAPSGHEWTAAGGGWVVAFGAWGLTLVLRLLPTGQGGSTAQIAALPEDGTA